MSLCGLSRQVHAFFGKVTKGCTQTDRSLKSLIQEGAINFRPCSLPLPTRTQVPILLTKGLEKRLTPSVLENSPLDETQVDLPTDTEPAVPSYRWHH
jgi:hypothetical protein